MPAMILLAALLLLPYPALGHGDAAWIMDNPATRHCCGPQDCRKLTAADTLDMTGQGYLLNGQPVREVYPVQPAGGSVPWACFYPPALTVPSCLFLPLGF